MFPPFLKKDINMARKLPKTGKIHSQVRAKNRKEAREVYSNMEMERDRYNHDIYERNRDLNCAFYGGLDPRRENEIADGGMIKEDNTAMSNLPKKGYQATYPSSGFGSSLYLDDSIKD